MYLFERFTGVLTYTIFLVIFTFLVKKFNRNKLGKILFSYSIVLSLMAFYFVPNPGSDLSRLWPIMQYYAKLNFKDIIEVVTSSKTPAAILYLYWIGKTSIDGLLPAITSFIFYSNVFYIIKDSTKKINSKSTDTSLILFYFMSAGVFLEVIAGIRSMLALSIVAVCFYKEIFNRKSLISTVLFYILAMLIHPIAIPVFILRLAILPFQKEFKSSKRLINFILTGFLSMLLVVLGNSYVVKMMEKANNYMTGNSYFYFWEYLKAFIGLFIIILVLIHICSIISYERKNLKYLNNNPLIIKNYFKFSILMCLVDVVFSFEYNTFHRILTFNTILTIPLFLYAIKYTNKKRKTLRYTIFFLSSVILFIAVTRGNLSSYKFFLK